MNLKNLKEYCVYEEYVSNFLKACETMSYIIPLFKKDYLFKKFFLNNDNIPKNSRYLNEEVILHLNDFQLNAYTLVGMDNRMTLIFINPNNDFNAHVHYSFIDSFYLDKNGCFKLQVRFL